MYHASRIRGETGTMAEDVRSEQASLSPAAGGVRQTPRRGYRRAARRPMSQGTGVFSGCLGFAIAALLGVSLFVLVAGVAIGRIGSWFDMNPFGMFAEPETSINDRRAAVVTEMRSLSRLETQQFTIEQVIEAEKDGNMFQTSANWRRAMSVSPVTARSR